MSTSPQRPAKVRKHLMVPGQPRRASRGDMSLSTVQKWVMSTLAGTTLMHLSGGVVLAAAFVEPTSSKIGLLVIGAGFGVVAMAAALLIHKTRLPHPLLLVGLLPALIGAWLIFS